MIIIIIRQEYNNNNKMTLYCPKSTYLAALKWEKLTIYFTLHCIWTKTYIAFFFFLWSTLHSQQWTDERLSKLPCDQTDTCLHLASSVPSLSPAPASVAPVYALCSGASHPFSPAASAHAPREYKIQGSIREAKCAWACVCAIACMYLCVCAHACVKTDKKVYLTLPSSIRIQPNAAVHSKESAWGQNPLTW